MIVIVKQEEEENVKKEIICYRDSYYNDGSINDCTNQQCICTGK